MDARIEIMPGEAGGAIPPDNFGYLLEVIGTSIYDGVWVGPDSRIPNVGGIRKDVIDHLRRIDTSVIRWPGGNFADSYDWKDGIGPRAGRPRRTSFWNDFFPKEVPAGPQRYDPNQFGTDEFLQLCRLTGGRPFLSVNVRGLSAYDFNRWVEYCNSPRGTTTLADQRAINGSPEPHNVRYWGIGNEVWFAGGSMSVEEYTDIYKRFATVVPDYGVKVALVAAGAVPGVSLEWVSKFIEGVSRAFMPTPMHSLSIHHYAGLSLNEFQPGDNVRKVLERGELYTPEALKFDVSDWYDMLGHYNDLDGYIQRHWDAMAEGDPKHRIKLAVDEWGAICTKGTEISPANYWSRAVTLRDVVGAALTLDILNRHCDKVAVACFTGLINQEGGLFLTDDERFVASGIYHVFRMYAAHQDAQLVHTTFDAPSIGYAHRGKSHSLWGINGSASRKGSTLTLTVVNAHACGTCEATVNIRDGTVRRARREVLSHASIHAYNTFEAPDTLFPVEKPIRAEGSSFVCDFPPASITRLTLELG